MPLIACRTPPDTATRRFLPTRIVATPPMDMEAVIIGGAVSDMRLRSRAAEQTARQAVDCGERRLDFLPNQRGHAKPTRRKA